MDFFIKINNFCIAVASGLRISCRWVVPRVSIRSCWLFLHSVKICLIVSWTPQVVQLGGSSFVIRCRWVHEVWPILKRFIIVFSLLEHPRGGGHGIIDFLISLSLVIWFYQYCHHLSIVWFFIYFLASVKEKSRIVIALGDMCESLVTSSAFSLPVICPGIHMQDKCFPVDRAMWQELWIFLTISVGLVVFLRLVNALSESLT